jgi:hypothetical protein
MIQIIPALIVAPVFMNGEIAFGVVTQSAMAFTTLVGASSLPGGGPPISAPKALKALRSAGSIGTLAPAHSPSAATAR